MDLYMPPEIADQIFEYLPISKSRYYRRQKYLEYYKETYPNWATLNTYLMSTPGTLLIRSIFREIYPEVDSIHATLLGADSMAWINNRDIINNIGALPVEIITEKFLQDLSHLKGIDDSFLISLCSAAVSQFDMTRYDLIKEIYGREFIQDVSLSIYVYKKILQIPLEDVHYFREKNYNGWEIPYHIIMAHHGHDIIDAGPLLSENYIIEFLIRTHPFIMNKIKDKKMIRSVLDVYPEHAFKFPVGHKERRDLLLQIMPTFIRSRSRFEKSLLLYSNIYEFAQNPEDYEAILFVCRTIMTSEIK